MAIKIIAEAKGKTSASITIRRPKWSDVYKNYPKKSPTEDMPANEVFTLLFGKNYSKDYTNACAARLSIALIRSNFPITFNKRKINGSNGEFKNKRIIIGAHEMRDWLKTANVWGEPDIKILNPITFDKVLKKLNGKTGVYIMVPSSPIDFGATGHVTLWTGNRVIGHDYANKYAYQILFWELI